MEDGKIKLTSDNLTYLRNVLEMLYDDKNETSRVIESLVNELRKEKELMGNIGKAIMELETEIRRIESGVADDSPKD